MMIGLLLADLQTGCYMYRSVQASIAAGIQLH